MEKCLHKIRENFSSYATVCSWFISAFFLTIKFEFGRKQIFQIDDDPRDTRKSWVILFWRRLMPKIRWYDIVVFYAKSILSPLKNHSQVAL